MGQHGPEGRRLTQRQTLGGACLAILLLLALLLGFGGLPLGVRQGARKGAHASTRIRRGGDAYPISPSLQLAFEEGYKKDSTGGEVLDSEGQAAAKYVQRTLMQVLLLNEVESMADIGCGTLSWMAPVLKAYTKEDPQFRWPAKNRRLSFHTARKGQGRDTEGYLGLDIARQVVEAHQKRYAEERGWDFQVFDSTQGVIPDHYELIFTRDFLQHLPLVAVVDVLERISQSGARLLLISTYKTLTPHEKNKNIGAGPGERFDVNLMSDPFFLNDPLAVYDEQTYQQTHGTHADRHLFLFSVEDLRRVDFGSMRQRAYAISSP